MYRATEGLLKLLNFRRHVGSAAYPIGGAATFENPDCVIGLRAFCVPRSAEWFVTPNALHPCLGREHVPRCLPCRLCRRSDQANARTVNNQTGNEIKVADASSQKNKGQKNSALEMLMSFHGTPSPSDDSNSNFQELYEPYLKSPIGSNNDRKCQKRSRFQKLPRIRDHRFSQPGHSRRTACPLFINGSWSSARMI